jgi:hypothetical protein
MKSIDELIKTPLSLQQVKRRLPGTKVMEYPDFAMMKTLPEKCVYLFLTSDNYGHFCAVMRRGNAVELFDSYGLPPEGEHAFVSREMLDHLKERDDLILNICKENGWNVLHNKKRLQEWKGSETCGRHCIERIRQFDTPIQDYVKWLTGIAKSAKTTPDAVVCYMVP